MTEAETLPAQGWVRLDAVLDATTVNELSSLSDGLLGERAGMRSLLELPWGVDFVHSSHVQDTLARLGYQSAFCVRGIFFDKHRGANWKVPWHQDRKIAVKERLDVEGFRGWSVKEDVPHCQPTSDVLADMVTLRYHLDDCGPDNGPLKVLPGTHEQGFLTINATERILQSVEPVVATCQAGDVIAMKPLVLHASSEAAQVGHRRVLHLEFARQELPGGLEWFWRV